MCKNDMMCYTDSEKPLLLTPEMLKQWNAAMEEEKEEDAEYYHVYWHSATTPKSKPGGRGKKIENEEEWFQQQEFYDRACYLDFKDNYLQTNVGRIVYRRDGGQWRELENQGKVEAQWYDRIKQHFELN